MARGFCGARYAMLMGLVAIVGCSQFVNPFKDDLSGKPSVSTPSVDGIRTANAAHHEGRRHHAPIDVAPHDGAVTHGPLLFECPYEEHADENGSFAWSFADYHDVVYWRARFLGNLIALPASWIVTPPWREMESDGEPTPNWFGESHDSKPAAAHKSTTTPAPEEASTQLPGRSLSVAVADQSSSRSIHFRN